MVAVKILTAAAASEVISSQSKMSGDKRKSIVGERAILERGDTLRVKLKIAAQVAILGAANLQNIVISIHKKSIEVAKQVMNIEQLGLLQGRDVVLQPTGPGKSVV